MFPLSFKIIIVGMSIFLTNVRRYLAFSYNHWINLPNIINKYDKVNKIMITNYSLRFYMDMSKIKEGQKNDLRVNQNDLLF